MNNTQKAAIYRQAANIVLERGLARHIQEDSPPAGIAPPIGITTTPKTPTTEPTSSNSQPKKIELTEQ